MKFLYTSIFFSLLITRCLANNPSKIDVTNLNIKFPTMESLKNIDEEIIRIPLKRAGNLFLIEAEIDSLKGNFVLDLGAPYLVLNSTYFRDYKINNNYISGTLTSWTDYIRKKKIKSLKVQGLEHTKLSADVTDLGEIENKRGVKILGLLGVAIFKKYIFDLDIYHQQLVLYKDMELIDQDTEMILQTPIIVHNDVLSVKAKAGGVNVNLSLDTAAEACILHNKLSSKVYKQMQVLRNSRVRDANGGVTEVLMTFMRGISVGDTEVRKMKTLVLNLNSMSRAYGQNIDGMLGYPFFSWGRTIIDFKNKKLYIYEFNRSKTNGK